MATLLLPRTASGSTASHSLAPLHSPSLRHWLRESDDWAILFSHPDDFVRYDLEMDRWLIVTRRAFAASHIRPLALASYMSTACRSASNIDPANALADTPQTLNADRGTLDSDRSWITQVSGDSRTVLLEDPARQHFGPVDLQVPVLREAIEGALTRFVMLIDNTLRKRKIFAYEALSNLPSPFELLGWAESLRSRQAEIAGVPPWRGTSIAAARAL